ncbi:hypothetical protein NBRC3222_1603 [Acetobacter pasteurianus NBRC 3222]|nr:hypothetical protein NBRC3222_1603 [Acetobacter pasteurianus NBRC 3222]
MLLLEIVTACSVTLVICFGVFFLYLAKTQTGRAGSRSHPLAHTGHRYQQRYASKRTKPCTKARLSVYLITQLHALW